MKPKTDYKGQVAALTEQLAQMKARVDGACNLVTRISSLQDDNKVLEIRLSEAFAAKDQLKALLADAYEQIASQRGYIDRALEDDAVREIGATRDKPASVSADTRRAGPQPMMRTSGAPSREYYDGGASVSYARSTQPHAWHSL